MIEFWSHTDFTYACLADVERVRGFERGINAAIQGGETVVDVGAGSGILGLLAARAGARKVYLVEVDALLASTLRTTVAANGLDSVIEVVEGDATEVDLPTNVDLVLAELIETWMLDEAQVPVMNALRRRGVIGPTTRVMPERYNAYVELVRWDNTFYGFEIAHPKHAWPNYEREPWWWQSAVDPVGPRVPVFAADFNAHVGTHIDAEVEIVLSGTVPNAVRISGEITLVDGVVLEMTPSLNGPKIMLLAPDIAAALSNASGPQRLRVTAELGSGLGSLELRLADSV